MSETEEEEYQSELHLLVRILKLETSRFIFVHYNHGSIRNEVKNLLLEKYPERKQLSIITSGKPYNELMNTIYSFEKGIIFFDDFEQLLHDESLYIGFNQRRDKLADFPIAYIFFLPSGNLLSAEVQKKMPDLYSFRSLEINLKKDILPRENDRQLTSSQQIRQSGEDSFADASKQTEFERLQQRLNEIEKKDENLALINSIYLQIFYMAFQLAEYDTGIKYGKAFLNLAEKKNYQEHFSLDYRNALRWMGSLYKHKNNSEKALSYQQQAYEISLQLNNAYELAQDLNYLAIIHNEIGQLELAEKYFKEALEMNIQNYGNKDDTVADIQCNLGLVYLNKGELQKAKKILKQSLKTNLENYPEHYTQIADVQSNLGLVYKDLFQYDKAKEMHLQSMEMNKKHFGEWHSRVAVNRLNLASVLYEQGEYEKAKEQLLKAKASDLKNFGEYSLALAKDCDWLALVYYMLGETEKAKENYKEVLKIYVANYGEDHPDVAKARTSLSLLEG